jgi:hypothetical protein
MHSPRLVSKVSSSLHVTKYTVLTWVDVLPVLYMSLRALALAFLWSSPVWSSRVFGGTKDWIIGSGLVLAQNLDQTNLGLDRGLVPVLNHLGLVLDIYQC